MHLLMIIKLPPTKLPLSNFVLIFMRRNRMLGYRVAVSILDWFRDVAFVFGFSASDVLFFADGFVGGLR
jgi:hypothetical protein